MALLAVCFLSLLSTLIGIGNYWTLELPERKVPDKNAPPGDVVVRHPKGAFLVVQCDEDVARQLFFAPETIDYWVENVWRYRYMSLLGTLMLMSGVVALGNATNVLQTAFAAAYMLINAAYWVVAALPARRHWNLSGFEVKTQEFVLPSTDLPHKSTATVAPSNDLLDEAGPEKEDVAEPAEKKGRWKSTRERWASEKKEKKIAKKKADAKKAQDKCKKYKASYNETFTWALFMAIVATGTGKWAIKNGAVPDTEAWQQWLHEAEQKAKEVDPIRARLERRDKGHFQELFTVPEWHPQAAIGRYMVEEKKQLMKEFV